MSEAFDEPEQTAEVERPSRARALLITAGVVVVGFIALTGFASFWTDRLWFRSVGYGEVFSKLLWTRVLLFAVFGVVMAAAVGFSMVLAYRTRPIFMPNSSEQTSLDRYREVVTPIRRWLFLAVAVVMGLFAGASASGQWRQFLLWRHGGSFGQDDPYFGHDIGFYVFDLAWLHYVTDFAMTVFVVSLMAAVVTHYLYGGIRLQGFDRISHPAAFQMSVLAALFLLTKGFDYWLDRFDVLSASGSVIDGMTYTDDHAVVPAKEILIGIAVVCALLFLINLWRRTWMLPSVGVALFVLSAILLGAIWPGVVQQLQVKPSEAVKERPYITNNIAATRAAYNLDDITITGAPNGAADQTAQQLAAATSSVPVMDPKVVQPMFQNLQQRTGFYSVPSVLDVDRYPVAQDERAMVLGVRELDQNGLNSSNKNWLNLHTVYTHGYGVIAAYGNQRNRSNTPVAGDADAVWAEGNLPPKGVLSDEGDGYEGRIYFGEQSPDYSIVGRADDGKDVEYDYPRSTAASSTPSDDASPTDEPSDEATDEATDDPSETPSDGASEGAAASGAVDANQSSLYTYAGKDGVDVGSAWRKLLYAVKFADPNIVLSSRVNENSKILYNRDPAERVEKVAPWLTLDGDPYPAVVDGRIQWIVDGYTTSDKYPLSDKQSFDEMTNDALADDSSQFQALPTDEINYMRNAVKATVDAYDGTVRLYEWDEDDPILQTWESVFPDLILPKTAISEDLMAHLRYPEDLFKVQRYQFASYHVTDADDFYQANDRWDVPKDPQNSKVYQAPYRMFVDNPGNDDGLTWAMEGSFVPYNRRNLAAFMSVNSDATSKDYGQITAVRNSDETIQGPEQVGNTFSGDQGVADRLRSFLGGAQASPIYGNMLAFPVDDRILWVEPLYVQRSDESGFPILTLVLTSFGGSEVGYGESLPESLSSLLDQTLTGSSGDTGDTGGTGDTGDGGDGGEDDPPSSGTPSGKLSAQVRQLLDEAQDAFVAADEALKAGDSVTWAEQTEIARQKVAQAWRLANPTPSTSSSPSSSSSSSASPSG